MASSSSNCSSFISPLIALMVVHSLANHPTRAFLTLPKVLVGPAHTTHSSTWTPVPHLLVIFSSVMPASYAVSLSASGTLSNSYLPHLLGSFCLNPYFRSRVLAVHHSILVILLISKLNLYGYGKGEKKNQKCSHLGVLLFSFLYSLSQLYVFSGL